MASQLSLHSGSPLIGSPITYQVRAASVNGETAFHRIIFQVKAILLQSGQTYESHEFTLSSPVESGELIAFDISSALRAVADTYEYTVVPPTNYPRVAFTLKVWDEYMQNGTLYENVGIVEERTTQYCLFGGFTDRERIVATQNGATGRKAQVMTRKPKTQAEVVMVGEQMVCPLSLASAVSCGQATIGPQSVVRNISSPGLQTINDHPVYAVPAGEKDRYEFRFVNGLGCLESVSVKSLREGEMNVTSTTNLRAIQETFGEFSRAVVTKKNDYETWKLTSGPLDEAWHSWFLHEFLMAKWAWIKVDGVWLTCHILPEETVTTINRYDGNPYEVDFSVRFDINGSPHGALEI